MLEFLEDLARRSTFLLIVQCVMVHVIVTCETTLYPRYPPLVRDLEVLARPSFRQLLPS